MLRNDNGIINKKVGVLTAPYFLIHLIDDFAQSELRGGFMSPRLHQEESRSISENVTWGHRKRFADGKVSMPYKRFLGYEKGEDGLPKIVETEAEVVRMIYRLFMEGKTSSAIARHLADSGIPSPAARRNGRSLRLIRF